MSLYGELLTISRAREGGNKKTWCSGDGTNNLDEMSFVWSGFKTENESSLLGSYKQTLCKGWSSHERCFLVELGNSHEAIRAIKENRQRQDEVASQYWLSLELKKIVATYEPSLNFSDRRKMEYSSFSKVWELPHYWFSCGIKEICCCDVPSLHIPGVPISIFCINIYSLSAIIQFNYGSSFAMARPHQTVTWFGEEGMDGCLLKPLDQLKQGLMRLGNSQRMEC
ncbi:hypothetical protein Ancab_004150 [Ancistrocladus abbreviatus]